MPEEEKRKGPGDIPVDLDTSGPEVDVVLEETKEETVDTAPETTTEEVVTETKETEKKEDEKLEDYSKGVQARIAKLTRKMREAERKEAAALEYAAAVEAKRKQDQEKFNKVDSDYTAKFEESVKSGMEMAQQRLASAIEAGDATAQVEANKKKQPTAALHWATTTRLRLVLVMIYRFTMMAVIVILRMQVLATLLYKQVMI